MHADPNFNIFFLYPNEQKNMHQNKLLLYNLCQYPPQLQSFMLTNKFIANLTTMRQP